MSWDLADMWPVLVAVVCGAFLIGVSVSRSQQARRRSQGAPSPLPAHLEEQARELIGRGKPIQAVKVVCDATGCDLRTAKRAVDEMRAGHPIPMPVTPDAQGRTLAARVRLLRDQQRIAEAVREVAAETGMSESEAARFVDTLE